MAEYGTTEEKLYVREKCVGLKECIRKIPSRIQDVKPSFVVQVRWISDVPDVEIKTAGDVADLVAGITSSDREVFYTVLLNRKNRVIGVEEVAKGSLTSAIVHPREVFKGAILNNAASLIMVHYHPSGNPEPSQDDTNVTERVVKTGRVVGIDVLDHVIVAGRDKYYSYYDAGLMRMIL